MEYSIIVNGRSYDLPKKTVAVMERLDAVLLVDSIKGLTVRQKYEKLHSFIIELIGKENAAEALGGEKLADLDVSEITLTIRRIVDAYERPIAEYQAEQASAKLNRLPLDRIVETMNAAEKVINMPQKK